MVFSRLRGEALEKVFSPREPAAGREYSARAGFAAAGALGELAVARGLDFRGVAEVPLRCGFGDLARAGAADLERGCNDMI